MYRSRIRDEGEFVWKRRRSWSQHLVRLLIVVGAIGALAWGTLLPINELTTRPGVILEPTSNPSSANSVSNDIAPQSHAPADSATIPGEWSEALTDGRQDHVETSPSMSEARQPDPWVIRTQ